MTQELFLVLGASGAQGGAVARRLVKDGHRVRGLSDRPAEVPGVEVIVGDLADREAVGAAFEGVTHASVVLPLVFDPPKVDAYVRNIVTAAQRAGVRRLVFNSSTRIPDEATGLPAFETRRHAEELILASGIPAVIVRPPVYLDNLANPSVAASLVNDGVLAYPMSADRRTAWISHEDLAEATVAALLNNYISGVLELGGRDTVTGHELAGLFAEALGREITYFELPADIFESGLSAVAGPEAAAGVASLYRWLAANDAPSLYEADPETLEKTLEITLTPLHAWIAAQPWRSLAS